jgi:hypothetical protein
MAALMDFGIETTGHAVKYGIVVLVLTEILNPVVFFIFRELLGFDESIPKRGGINCFHFILNYL